MNSPLPSIGDLSPTERYLLTSMLQMQLEVLELREQIMTLTTGMQLLLNESETEDAETQE